MLTDRSTARARYQERLVAELKDGARPEFPHPIAAVDRSVIGSLEPITHKLAADPRVIEALFRWRRAHMDSFLTVFTPSLEKTRQYLASFSLPDPARVLFLLRDAQGRLVGHVGLCNISENAAEIDNVVRGEQAPCPAFMTSALATLLRWAFSDLRIPLAYLQVLSRNERALKAYEKVGLTEVSRTPTIRQDIPGGYKLIPAAGHDTGPRGPHLIRMEVRDGAEIFRNGAKHGAVIPAAPAR
jgi:RimJ/RimL family protein N-acetyltransferase